MVAIRTDRWLTIYMQTNRFAHIPHGLLSEGTVTHEGTIAFVSFTAYQMEGGDWFPFAAIHGPYKPVTPLFVF